MPVVLKHPSDPVPKVHHVELETTFSGVEHPLSTPETRIYQYLGIKYASVPARFRQSKLWARYPLFTDASKYGPICPQINSSKSLEEALLGLSDDVIPKSNLQQDEFECLNLNITCPAGLTDQSRLPVMLWIHGGGDTGSGSSWLFDGGALVRKSMIIKKPMIVVNINFRIGLFGFGASNYLHEDNKVVGDEGVGNYGLRDQRKAMEWLHHFIGCFGGDPNNITVFGYCTGGADIICHLLSEENETHPLFHRAIVQSVVLEPIVPDVSTAGWHLTRIMAALRVSTIEELRSIDANKLIMPGQTLWAVDDGTFFRKGWQDYLYNRKGEQQKHHAKDESLLRVFQQKPRSKSRLDLRPPSRDRRSRSRSSQRPHTPQPGPQAHHFAHQPLIIGDCSSDSLLWSLPISLWSPSGVVRRLRAVCQSLTKANSILRAYDITSYTPDVEIVDHVLDLVNDARIAWPTECIAQSAKRERGGQGVWRYVFDQESPSRGVAHHAADLMYLFDNVPLQNCTRGPNVVIQPNSPPMAATPTPTMVPTPEILKSSLTMTKSPMSPPHITRGRHATPQLSQSCTFDEIRYDEDLHFDDSDSEGSLSFTRLDDDEFEWMQPTVDEWSYTRVRDAIQEKWIAFANGEVPWKEDKVFVFGPEGETGERSMSIFEGRRRKQVWQRALEPLGMHLVQKIGVELSRGPPISARQ
ncbi:hypothetical protein AX17_004080 [Amanita inopinata Kibby_2008]|nr:hypothetical protein AX17_004080 [Amanita inopinata Kibby_2008]